MLLRILMNNSRPKDYLKSVFFLFYKQLKEPIMKNLAFAFAMVAACSSAKHHDFEEERLPGMTLRYESTDDYFLGLVPGQSVELELKGEWIVSQHRRWWRRRWSWCHWMLMPLEDGESYQGFTVTQEDGCDGKFMIMASDDAVDSGE